MKKKFQHTLKVSILLIKHFPDSEVVLCDSIEDCLNTVSSGKATCTLINSDTYYAYRNDF